jgi:hypothetical protein
MVAQKEGAHPGDADAPEFIHTKTPIWIPEFWKFIPPLSGRDKYPIVITRYSFRVGCAN